MGQIGAQRDTEATEEGSVGVGVIWSRLKPEQGGLVTEAYLWRRRRGSETEALRENLLQTKRGEKFMSRSRGDKEGGSSEDTRGKLKLFGSTAIEAKLALYLLTNEKI